MNLKKNTRTQTGVHGDNQTPNGPIDDKEKAGAGKLHGRVGHGG